MARMPQDSPNLLCQLSRLPGLHADLWLKIVSAGYGADELLRGGAPLWRELELPIALQRALATLPRDDVATNAIDRLGVHLVTADHPAYPPQLLAIGRAPFVLFVRGNPQILHTDQLAIVGSRHPTALGKRTARDFAFHFASLGLAITSGLALGIDAAAHEAALLAAGSTIAVCAHGLDLTYPSQHRELAERIAEQGAIVSEFPPGVPPLPAHFPQRNRLISGLSVGVLVVEAAARSGSLVTARHAAEQGREVFAVPGSIHSPQSRGCHQLLRQGAILVESADDILSELKNVNLNQCFMSSLGNPEAPSAAAARLDNPTEILLDALGFEPTSLDALIASTGLSSTSVASLLLSLELEGRVASDARGRYFRL